MLTGQPLEYPAQGPAHVFRHVGPQIWEPTAETPDWLLQDGVPSASRKLTPERLRNPVRQAI